MRLATEPPVESIRHELRFALTDSMREEFVERARTGFASEPRRRYSIYYDTPGGALWRQGIALQVAAIDGGYLQTVKVCSSSDAPGGRLRSGRMPADPFDGLQWERVTLTPMHDASALPPETSPIGAAIRDCLPLLRPVFEIDIHRQTRIIVPEEGVRFELSCDQGIIRTAGGACDALDEVELLQQAGPDGIFHRYALQWARLHGAAIQPNTRLARGMALAGQPPAEWVPAPRRPLPAEGSVDVQTAATRVLGRRLEQFVEHLPAVLESEQPRGPDQLRTALRRLRAGIRFFELREDRQRATDLPWRAIDAMATELLDTAGPLCRGDHLSHDLLPVLEAAFPRDPALARLRRALQDYRASSRERLRLQLRDPRTTEFILLTSAALGALDEPLADAGPHATRLGTIDDERASQVPSARPPSAQVPSVQVASAAPWPSADAGRPASAGRSPDDRSPTEPRLRDGQLTAIFDSSPGGITVWEDKASARRQAGLRFDGFAARRLSGLASRAHDLAGAAAISDDGGPTRAGLRRLRQAIRIAEPVASGRQRPRRLMAQLRRWEARLGGLGGAGGAGVGGDAADDATRATVASAMQTAQATESMTARVLGLIDGYRAFRRQQSGKPGKPGTGSVEIARDLQKMLRRHFDLSLDEGDPEQPEGGPEQRPVPRPRLAPSAAFIGAPPLSSPWSASDRVIDLSEHGRAPLGPVGPVGPVSPIGRTDRPDTAAKPDLH